jgi:hypothetical protein
MLRQAIQTTAAAVALGPVDARLVADPRRPRLAVIRYARTLSYEQQCSVRDQLTRLLREVDMADMRVVVLDGHTTLSFYDDEGQYADEPL